MKIGTRQFFFGTRNGIFLSNTEEIKNPEKFFYWLLTKNKIGKIVNLIFQIRQLSSSIWDKYQIKGWKQIMIPKDPVMLLSYVNTQLRDFYRSLDAFCEDRGLNRKELEDKLDMIDYAYDPAVNQFV